MKKEAMQMTLRLRRPTNDFWKCFVKALVIIALAGLVVSPARAARPGGVVVNSSAEFIDPCRPAVSFSSGSQSVPLGTSTTLNWSVQAPSECGYSLSMSVIARPQINLSPGAAQDWDMWTSAISVAAQPQGSLQVQPAFNTVYVLVVALGANNTIFSAPIQVAVSLPPDPKCIAVVNASTFAVMNPSTSVLKAQTNVRGASFALADAPPCRNRVTIDASNLAPLLVQALGTPNTTVIVADEVELNLAPHLGGPISIASGVRLLGGRSAQPGKRFQRGPRLFVTPYSQWNSSNWPDPLFQIDGDNVRFSGVRLEGPGAPPDAWRSIPKGYTRAIQFVDKINIEIDHNEFSGWNTAAVEAQGNTGDRVWQSWTSKVTADSSGIRYPGAIEPVSIHDNYFHSNWYSSPTPWNSCGWANPKACEPYFGYGVVASGTHLLIERNVFNDYFHAIAANGCPGSGYRAYRNLVLTHGGVADDQAQQAFDVHHRRPADCGGSDGAAGHDFDVRWNSFLYRAGPALFINGTPDVGTFVGSNVFANDHVKDDAVVLGNHGDGGKLWSDGNNLEGVKSWDDPSHFSDACDFDGDGINDRFLTTGETWWFRSGDQSKGWTPWVFLNTSTLLVENVRLGYFSVDALRNHVCDVATIDGGYKGGTGPYGPLK
jgi:hypothetical protein